MPSEIFSHLPQSWAGIFAVLAFIVWAGAQVVEKFPIVAKHVPLGKWWHNRQKRKGSRVAWVAEDNEVIEALQTQITTIARELAKVSEKVQVFTAFSTYDEVWHHRLVVTNAGSETCLLPRHYNFFEYEQLWKRDPVAAATL